MLGKRLLASGKTYKKHTKNHGKSPCFMGKLWKNSLFRLGHFQSQTGTENQRVAEDFLFGETQIQRWGE